MIKLKDILLNEQSVSFPLSVKGNYIANNCDELHAFQSTGGKKIGNMNVIVGNKLKEIYKSGYNPKVTEVNVVVSNKTVKWEAIITESKDGNAWIGFTSRGAGCNNDIQNRATSTQSGNDIGTLRSRIVSAGLNSNDDFELEEVNDYVYDGGKDSFKQVFYRYTRPNDYPPHTSLSSPTTHKNSIKHNNDQKTLKKELKYLGKINLKNINYNSNQVNVITDTTSPLVSMSYIWSDADELDKVFQTVKNANPNTPPKRLIRYDINGLPGYIIIFKQSEK